MAVPYLTGGSFAALQGVNAYQSTTLTINGFAAPAASSSYMGAIFALIFQDTGNGVLVYQSAALDPSTTSLSILPGTLASNTKYVLELQYGNEIDATDTSNSAFQDSNQFQSFYQITDIAFTTSAAVPEPSSLALCGLASLAGLGVAVHRWKAAN